MVGDVCVSVYAHWDGYLAGVGRNLLAFYNEEQAQQLVDLGDLSSVGTSIGTQHSFDASTNECTFYGRDRGEKGVSAIVSSNFEEFMGEVDNCGAEYYYIMKDGEWYAGCVYEAKGLVKGGLVPLADALLLNN